jgi:hypothetical protein
VSAGLLCYMRGGLVGAMVVWWKRCDAELLEYVWVLGVGSRAVDGFGLWWCGERCVRRPSTFSKH